MRIQITQKRALFAHPSRYVSQPHHGPSTWPWWRLISVKAYRANPDVPFDQAPVHHWLVWFYTRWGATNCHVGLDCRTPKQRGLTVSA